MGPHGGLSRQNHDKTASSTKEHPSWASVLGKFKKLKIGTVFEYHIYELFKFSLRQIKNGFPNLTIGTQQRQTRNVSFNDWNFSETNDMLDSSNNSDERNK